MHKVIEYSLLSLRPEEYNGDGLTSSHQFISTAIKSLHSDTVADVYSVGKADQL